MTGCAGPGARRATRDEQRRPSARRARCSTAPRGDEQPGLEVTSPRISA
jgi:hypothetical protein